jgi:hypothetical protein
MRMPRGIMWRVARWQWKIQGILILLRMGRVMMMQCKWMMVVTLEKERLVMLAGWIVCSQKRDKHRLRWCVKL